MDQLTKIVSRLVEITKSSEDQTVLGVRLGAAIRATFPHFSPAVYQCKNLRQFVKKHVPQLVEKPSSNSNDVLYSLAEAGTPETEVTPPQQDTPENTEGDSTTIPGLPIDSVSWKAYSNPGYPLAVVANKETSEVKTIGSRESPQAPWVLIPKLSSSELHKIAMDFVATLPAAHQVALNTILGQQRWYVNFFHAAQRFGHGIGWSKYKRLQLVARFTKALQESGVTAPLHTVGEEQKGSASSARPSRKATDLHRVDASSESELRELVVRLAHLLPLDELRSIRMPLGLILDALKR